MHEKRGSGEESYYYLVLYYQGKILHYRLQQFYSDREATHWHLYAKNGLQQFKWYSKEKRLEHVTIYGQCPIPEDFLTLLEGEFKEIHTTG